MAAGVVTAAVSGVAGQLVGALDGLFTSDDERNQARIKMQEVLQQPQMMQALANIRAAEHPSLFVAGARPAALWVCVAGFAWEFLIRPVLGSVLTIASLWGGDPELMVLTAAELPNLDTGDLISLMLALLGLAGWRSLDKANGVARERLKP